MIHTHGQGLHGRMLTVMADGVERDCITQKGLLYLRREQRIFGRVRTQSELISVAREREERKT